MSALLDLDLLDDRTPFEIDAQAAHLFKHPRLGIEDVIEVWMSDPLFYPAKPRLTGSWWLRSRGGSWSSPSPPLDPPTRSDAVLSVATKLQQSWLPPTERIDMSIDPATAEQEYDFFAQAANQVPQGPPRRRSRRLSAPVPVRFSPEVLQRIRERADADDRSVSSWIRRAVENELGRSA